MVQRDIIKDQIEQAGKVIGRLISELFNLQLSGRHEEAEDLILKTLFYDVDINLEELLLLNQEALKAYINSNNISEKMLDGLARLSFEFGNLQTESGKANKYFFLAKNLIEVVSSVSDTLTMDRMLLSSKIDKELKL